MNLGNQTTVMFKIPAPSPRSVCPGSPCIGRWLFGCSSLIAASSTPVTTRRLLNKASWFESALEHRSRVEHDCDRQHVWAISRRGKQINNPDLSRVSLLAHRQNRMPGRAGRLACTAKKVQYGILGGTRGSLRGGLTRKHVK